MSGTLTAASSSSSSSLMSSLKEDFLSMASMPTEENLDTSTSLLGDFESLIVPSGLRPEYPESLPSSSSSSFPFSPSGPLLAHISISSPESSEAPELTPTNSPDPAPSIPPSVPSPAKTAKPRLASPSSSPTLPSKNASSLVKSSASSSRSRQQAPPAEPKPAQPPPPLPSQPVPALPARPVPNFVMQPPSSVPNLKLDSSSEDVEDEFQDELHFDPTISSGHLTGGGFRSTPVTVGVCPTPQPLTPAPTPRPEVPDKPVDEMTPVEADNLLADRLMERRSRAGSVLSDEQAEEVERLLSPAGEEGSKPVPPSRSSSKEETALLDANKEGFMVDSGANSLESSAVDKLG